MAIGRRTFLKGAAAAGGAAFAGPFGGFVASPAFANKPSPPLGPVPDLRDQAVRLWLPEGFAYRSFHDTTTTQKLTDNTTLPGRHDGMAAFAGPDGNVWLVRNHEVNGPVPAFGPTAPTAADAPYDTMTGGGTTTSLVTLTGEVLESFTSLNGTQMNCAGGRMPWGSWITCEETVNGPDVAPDFTNAPNIALTRPHGFIFEVPAGGKSNRQPIRSAGRFAHEAAAYDPAGNALYLTEDDFGFPSGFYRYQPPNNPMEDGHLDDGGQLQMLAVVGMPNANLAASQRRRATYAVEWVDIADPAPAFPYTPGVTAPTSNNTALTYVASQGWAQGAAWFSRLEGAVYDNNTVYFTSTQGGGPAETSVGPIADGFGNGSGQVWAYRIGEGVLQLIYESPGPAVLDLPDNITTSRRGTMILCEDNVDDNYIRALSRGGQLTNVALNRLPGRTNDEFAGATFSADDTTLFVNIQASRGMTFAIWGPWHRIGV